MSLAERWGNQLEQLRAQGRYRQMRAGQGIDFSSNDYLGYGSGARRSLAFSTETAWPRSGMASRLLRGQHELWDKVEARLAQWHGAEASLMFPCGYMANEGLLATVVEPGDWVASDALNHASLIDGLRLSRAEKFLFGHRDYIHLAEGLKEASSKRKLGQELFVVTESLFSMEGTTADLARLVELCRDFEANLIVDEAHATGCVGPAGSGGVDQAGIRAGVLATVHTGGKALGTVGAYVCGSARLKALLVNRCRHFLFTTALPPQVAAWWLETIDLVKGDEVGRARLHENVRLFLAEMVRHGLSGFPQAHIGSVVIGGDARAVAAAERLQAAGWDIRAIRPPTVPPGTARLRISLHADHTPELLIAAAAAIAEVVQ